MDVVGRGVQKVLETRGLWHRCAQLEGRGEALEERMQEKTARSTYPSPSPLLAPPASLQRKKEPPHHHHPRARQGPQSREKTLHSCLTHPPVALTVLHASKAFLTKTCRLGAETGRKLDRQAQECLGNSQDRWP